MLAGSLVTLSDVAIWEFHSGHMMCAHSRYIIPSHEDPVCSTRAGRGNSIPANESFDLTYTLTGIH